VSTPDVRAKRDNVHSPSQRASLAIAASLSIMSLKAGATDDRVLQSSSPKAATFGSGFIHRIPRSSPIHVKIPETINETLDGPGQVQASEEPPIPQPA